jgi:hypothetical protein
MVYDTAQHTDILAAQVAQLPSPPSHFSDAVALIAGIIVQQGTSSIVEIRDQRPVVGFRAPAINASADHSSLLNLTNDDHPQYLLTNGSRTLTGNLIMGSNSITGVNLINSVNITSHASRHLPGGTDALATGTPSTIGITNQIGNIAAFARQDHIHAHGNLDGGTLHTLVTATVSGFMSAPDKVILDSITSLTQSLTNKGITGSTNYVESNALKTTTNPVYIVASAPILGQVLMAVSATQATWQTAPMNTGPTGSSGSSGTSGSSGSSGTSGSSGSSGTSGSSGSSGSSGTSGSSGSSGTSGSSGSSGTSGSSGSSGTSGSSGSSGTSGSSGSSGSSGTSGSSGSSGTSGSSGSSGTSGSSGSSGTSGSSGSSGTSGTSGATGATGATGSVANTTTQKTPTDPTVTASLTGVMMGLSASITPVVTGKVLIIVSGDIDNDSGDDGAQVQMRTGTGTPPINGAALTGTAQGGLVKMDVATSGAGNSVTRVPFSLNTIVTGLTLNTAVWIDVSLAAIGAGNARVRDISISIVEL